MRKKASRGAAADCPNEGGRLFSPRHEHSEPFLIGDELQLFRAGFVVARPQKNKSTEAGETPGSEDRRPKTVVFAAPFPLPALRATLPRKRGRVDISPLHSWRGGGGEGIGDRLSSVPCLLSPEPERGRPARDASCGFAYRRFFHPRAREFAARTDRSVRQMISHQKNMEYRTPS
jgi:hypothetical protein